MSPRMVASMPWTAAASPATVVTHGTPRRTAAVRISYPSSRTEADAADAAGWLPKGVFTIRSTSPSRMRVTTVGSPPGPAPSLCFRTILARTPFLRRTSAVPDVAQISNPRSASRLTGKTMARLSLFATDTNTRPLTGSDPYTASCDFPYAVPNIESIPITSPVERISGPSTVSTPAPEASRNRPNGSTASLTATGESSGSVPPSLSAGSTPDERSDVIDDPSITSAAAFASGTAVALDTNGTVREARGFASSTYSTPAASAYWTFSSP